MILYRGTQYSVLIDCYIKAMIKSILLYYLILESISGKHWYHFNNIWYYNVSPLNYLENNKRMFLPKSFQKLVKWKKNTNMFHR